MAKYSAMDIATYIIKKRTELKKPIDNLKLQKILYFIQKEFLVKKNRALFDDEFVAWEYGPVQREVYYQYNMFNGFTMVYGAIFPKVIDIDDEDKSVIDEVINRYIDYIGWDLVEESHKKGGAWDRTWKNGVGRNHIITKESIKQYG